MANTQTFKGHRGCINTCSFNPYGSRLLTGCDDGCVWMWDLENRNQKPLLMVRPHATNVFTTNFLSSTRFVSGGNDANVQVVELGEGRVTATTFKNHHQRKVMSTFVIDPFTFVSASHDKTVRIFDTRQQYPSSQVSNLPILAEADFNYDGNERLNRDIHQYGLMSQAHGGGLLRLPDESPPEDTVLLDFRGEENELYSLDVHPIDSRIFLTCGSDGTVRIYDMRILTSPQNQKHVGFCVNPHYQRMMSVTGAAFNCDGSKIAATVINGAIFVFDSYLASNIVLRSYREDARHYLPMFRNNIPNNSQADRTVNGVLKILEEHNSNETFKGVNWMGKFVVTGSDEAIIYIYDPDSGEVVNVLEGHDNHVNVVAVHQEKKMLATSGIDPYAKVWEPTSLTGNDREAISARIARVREDANTGQPCPIL